MERVPCTWSTRVESEGGALQKAVSGIPRSWGFTDCHSPHPQETPQPHLAEAAFCHVSSPLAATTLVPPPHALLRALPMARLLPGPHCTRWAAGRTFINHGPTTSRTSTALCCPKDKSQPSRPSPQGLAPVHLAGPPASLLG